jgi:hypothetical protein
MLQTRHSADLSFPCFPLSSRSRFRSSISSRLGSLSSDLCSFGGSEFCGLSIRFCNRSGLLFTLTFFLKGLKVRKLRGGASWLCEAR